MVDKTLSQVRTDNPAVAPTGVEPIESVQSATSAAFTFAELANSPLNPQVGTTYTLAITDQSKTVTMNNAAANTVTIPLNATVAFHIGAKLLVRQIGAGGTTIAATGGVTIELDANASLIMDGVQQQILLHKTATNTWHASVVLGGASIIDISTFVQGAPTDAEKLMTFVVTAGFTLPSGMTGSKAYAEVVSTAAATIDIIKNGAVASGTINFALGANIATFTLVAPLAFVAGDRLQLINQGAADATLSDVSITLRGDL